MNKGKQFLINPKLKINCYRASDNSCWVVRESAHKKILKLYGDKDQFYIEDSKGSLYLYRFQGVNKSYGVVVRG